MVEEEFKRVGAIGVAKVGIRTLAAATILAHGTDLQKEKFLLRILTGEDIWCQLFSEPGSGSDLAGAVTRAEFRGNQWVVNGQKVWTTSAHKAHWGLLLARTDWDQRKHQGLSYFILDMKQPGVTVQPLRQMNGYASFNQVFMTDAKVEPEFLVSEVGDGWAVTTTTLMHERRGADGLRSWAIASDKPGRAYDEESVLLTRLTSTVGILGGFLKAPSATLNTASRSPGRARRAAPLGNYSSVPSLAFAYVKPDFKQGWARKIHADGALLFRELVISALGPGLFSHLERAAGGLENLAFRFCVDDPLLHTAPFEATVRLSGQPFSGTEDDFNQSPFVLVNVGRPKSTAASSAAKRTNFGLKARGGPEREHVFKCCIPFSPLFGVGHIEI